MPEFQSYVICTSPRSGSTLLCKLLSASRVAGHPKSYFHEPSLEDWVAYYGLETSNGKGQAEILKEVFAAAIQRGSGDTGVFGMRLQRHSFGFFLSKLAVLHPDCAGDRARFQAAFGKTLFIHLTREDKVAQAVSFVKAEQTGLWHKAPDGTELERLSPHQDPVYCFETLKQKHDAFLQYDADWNDWFCQQGIEPLRLSYDSLAADPQFALQSVLNELKVDLTGISAVVTPTKKLADGINAHWANRFQDDYKSQKTVVLT